MDQIGLNEIITIIFNLRQSMDIQIQFWISVTFALVVVSYSAGARLSFQLRLLAGVLYALATSTFIARWIHDYLEMQLFLSELTTKGIELGTLEIAATLRLLLLIFGAISALIFLFKPSISNKV